MRRLNKNYFFKSPVVKMFVNPVNPVDPDNPVPDPPQPGPVPNPIYGPLDIKYVSFPILRTYNNKLYRMQCLLDLNKYISFDNKVVDVKYPNNDLVVNSVYITNISKFLEKPDKSYRWINLQPQSSCAMLIRKMLDGGTEFHHLIVCMSNQSNSAQSFHVWHESEMVQYYSIIVFKQNISQLPYSSKMLCYLNSKMMPIINVNQGQVDCQFDKDYKITIKQANTGKKYYTIINLGVDIKFGDE